MRTVMRRRSPHGDDSRRRGKTLDEVAARLFGEAKALLERKGQRLADADLLIGAMAAARGATVVTGNTRHVERFPGVALEDWMR